MRKKAFTDARYYLNLRGFSFLGLKTDGEIGFILFSGIVVFTRK
ncbi:hypothetical protein ADICYQ_4076 [Cyclobacterium qasimii M12-11B]|uniref:Uncharacterized protein n=1 Tax=Cyclobacterium qasimii M12-11B TaxID=641524 RepID=S7V9A3_9BACT|nr:hypothetical protein ADICYQ_4076 [Cyclobacterium qasimii M12-11B]